MHAARADEDLLDLLIEMRHDLGKYIVMPVAMLPADADDGAVRSGLRRALLQTRPSAHGGRSAADLWKGFVAEGGDALAALPGFDALQTRVHGALKWQAVLDDDAPIDRGALLSDLRAVGDTLGDIIHALGER